MAEENNVQLYIYDLSGGIAATMSPLLIGMLFLVSVCWG